MKKLILSMVLTAITALPLLAADSSDYVPIVREGVEWGNKAISFGYCDSRTVYYRAQLKGDTIINGKTYKKCYRYTERELDTSTANLASFMREENKRVYVYPNVKRYEQEFIAGFYDLAVGYYTDNENLEYDFNLQAGDTEIFCGFRSSVNEVKDTVVNGSIRKKFTLIETNYGQCERIVLEGIGSIKDFIETGDFIFPYQDQFSGRELWRRYVTYEKNVGGEIVYKTEYFDANDPAIRPEGIAQVSDGAADVRVYGTDGAAVIVGDVVSYAVYSADGLQVATGIADGETEIPLPSGLYIVRTGSRATKIAVK